MSNDRASAPAAAVPPPSLARNASSARDILMPVAAKPPLLKSSTGAPEQGVPACKQS